MSSKALKVRYDASRQEENGHEPGVPAIVPGELETARVKEEIRGLLQKQNEQIAIVMQQLANSVRDMSVRISIKTKQRYIERD